MNCIFNSRSAVNKRTVQSLSVGMQSLVKHQSLPGTELETSTKDPIARKRALPANVTTSVSQALFVKNGVYY